MIVGYIRPPMGFSCGIVGLPNVGKSTIFNAMTTAAVPAENYPFCTIDPNVGVVALTDPRLERIAALFKPEKTTPTTVEFVDIAGLVEGAHKGEGLGNQFLGHIKDVNAIVHVVRCFEDKDVTHVSGTIDPVRDVEVIETELMLADLSTVEKRIEKIAKQAKTGQKEVVTALAVYEKVRAALSQGKSVRTLSLQSQEREAIREACLLTAKPVLYVANIGESDLSKKTEAVTRLEVHAQEEGSRLVVISGKIESEIAQLKGDEKKEFMQEMGLEESGLNRLARAGYETLNLICYFTAGPKEVKAWTIPSGTKAPQAAGMIHSDFEKGFIRAETYHFKDLDRLGSELKVREAGLMRSEGKEYVVQDGDILFFRFAPS